MTKQLKNYNGNGGTWDEDLMVAGNFTAKGSVKVRGILMVGGDVNIKGDLDVEKLLCAGRVKCHGKLKAHRSGYFKSLQTGVFDESDLKDFRPGGTD